MRLLRALTTLVVGVAALVLAPSALAAFPGTNGMLVLVPAHGGGLALIDARGHGLHTICTDPSLCGQPTAPRFSPNGQAIAFGDARSGRTVVVATDGTCLWCLLGPQLIAGKAAYPAFKANAQALSYSAGQNVYTTLLSGGATTPLATPTPGARGPITGDVWSPGGALAFVRSGSVWLVRVSRAPRRIGPGAQPTFSPDAKRLAFVRQGWIWVVNVTGGRPRRLVRGSAPAYSPDGRALAFIAHGNRVYVVGARGGRPRQVPGVAARALDWQPLTATSSGRCSIPAGSSVLAQSSQALVTYSPSTPSSPWTGCLQTTGTRWPLASVTPGTNTSLGQIQLAGRFVIFLLTATDAAMHCTNAVDEVDLGSGAFHSLYTQNCAGNARGIDSLGVDSSGFAAWRTHEQVATAQPLTGVACASSTWCVAVDGHGNAATATSPLSPTAWSLTKVAPAFTDVRCPTASLCVGFNGGQISTATSPGGAWSAPVTIDPAGQIADVSCPSSTLCVAVDNAGNVLTSTAPTGGASAWQLANIDGLHFLSGVSCPSTSLCVAVGQNGDVLTSSLPAGGGSTWSPPYTGEPTLGLFGVSCPSVTLCVSSDSAGNMLRTSHPLIRQAWTPLHVPGEAGLIDRPVCPTTSLCVARDGSGDVIAIDLPSGPAPTFTITNLAPALSGLSCAPAASGVVCAAADTSGVVHVTGDPTTGAAGWSSVGVDVPACAPCIAEQLYAHDDRATQALDAVQPGSGSVLADVGLGANSTYVSWTHAGARHSYPLR